MRMTERYTLPWCRQHLQTIISAPLAVKRYLKRARHALKVPSVPSRAVSATAPHMPTRRALHAPTVRPAPTCAYQRKSNTHANARALHAPMVPQAPTTTMSTPLVAKAATKDQGGLTPLPPDHQRPPYLSRLWVSGKTPKKQKTKQTATI